MLTGRDVVIISAIDWDWKWQGPQEIAVRLARHSNRVLFIENPGVRAPRAKDAKRLFKRATNIVRTFRSSIREVETGVVVCSPAVLPPFGSRLRRSINRWLVRFSIGRAARALELEDPVIFVCLATDVSLAMAELFATERSPLIYYAVSDLLVMTDNPEDMARIEKGLIEAADLVFTIYLPLIERFGVPNVDLHLIPYGVDIERFQLEGRIRRPERPGPVVGYVGGISQHLDVGLLNEIAKRRPDWTFVLIGPQQPGGEGLVPAANTLLLGHVRHAELPEWVRGFDVGLIPYRRSAYTDTVYPVKLNEYLALGLPVVSVDLPALVSSEEDGVLWLSTPNPEDFVTTIDVALGVSHDQDLVKKRRANATAHDWGGKVELMSRLIEGVVKP